MKPKRLLLVLVIIAILFEGCCKDYPQYPGRTTAIFNPNKTYGTVTDIDGNVYKTITIGKQTWMAENLRVTRYRNGDPIRYLPVNKNGQDSLQFMTQGVYCAYNDTANPDSIATYGLLYGGYAVTDPRGIAPEGWHVPTAQEWDSLIVAVNYGINDIDDYGNSKLVGGKLKEGGNRHWHSPNYANNTSGFSALPGGFRFTDNTYNRLGSACLFWTSTSYSPSLYKAYSDPKFNIPALFMRGIWNQFTSIGCQPFHMYAYMISIRCIKNK